MSSNLDYLYKTGSICFFENLENKNYTWAREREVNSDVQSEVKAKISKEA